VDSLPKPIPRSHLHIRLDLDAGDKFEDERNGQVQRSKEAEESHPCGLTESQKLNLQNLYRLLSQFDLLGQRKQE
jgi:hypothetical protein